MEISMNLNVSAEYLFQRLLDTLLYDIKQETGRELTVAELSDLSYATKLDHQTKAQLKVIKLIPDRSYHLQIETDHYVKKEAYELTPLAKDQVKVDYREESLVKKHRVSMPCIGKVLSEDSTTRSAMLRCLPEDSR